MNRLSSLTLGVTLATISLSGCCSDCGVSDRAVLESSQLGPDYRSFLYDKHSSLEEPVRSPARLLLGNEIPVFYQH